MNERFFALPEERRNAIVNAGFHVFSKHGYKKASTDEIAREAGISKALLFHYFESKKGLFAYLYDYGVEFLADAIGRLHDYDETDFFEIFANAQGCKIEMLREHPDAMQFLVSAYLEGDPAFGPEFGAGFQEALEKSSRAFLVRADASKFRDGITVEQVLNIVLWMSDGFMRAQPPQALADLEAVNNEFLAYLELLRRQFYKEEYL